ncbi:MAG TPA: VWA domain-containing protein [Blastocatellia bacterium]|nr:VWA domain-containing protein [Blastocatellia bacterium]
MKRISSPRDWRRVLTLTAVLICTQSAFTQTSQTERTFPTQDNPRIIVSNVPAIVITSWARNEVSIAQNVAGTAVQVDDVTIKAESNKLDVAVHPSKPDRDVTLLLQVPPKAVVELKSFGTTVVVREPAGKISINASKNLLQLNVPETTALDMQNTPIASATRQLGPGGFAQIGIGGRSTGQGPPYIKVATGGTPTNVVIGSLESPKRPVTMAAQTIARRGGLMGQSLRREYPHLVRRPLDQGGPAAAEDRQEGALRLEAHLVNLNVSATDSGGRAVPGLKQGDFSVYEDGVPQRISFFSPEQSPFNLVLLLDLSGSMRDEVELLKETAIHFLSVIGSQDNVAVVTFTTDVTVVSHLTKDRDELRESIDYMLAPAGGTAFYDALGYALVEELRKVKGQRNAVITITDGEDNSIQWWRMKPRLPQGMAIPHFATAGSFLSFDQLLDGATEGDALIYPIHLNPSPQPQSNIRGIPQTAAPSYRAVAEVTEIATRQLQSLAEASGGRFYHANRIEDLKGVFEQVAAELRTVYSMAYNPSNLSFDGRFRRIRVQVNRPDVVVRTRPGYYGR